MCIRDRAQLVEQLICNQQVGGSNPSIGSVIGTGEIPKWPTGADCKSAASQPVSYTHLRAHETVLDLVCRLLLEKKKKQKTLLITTATDE